MDTKVIEINKNIFVYAVLASVPGGGNKGEFNFDIYVEFIPDAVIVNDISYCYRQFRGTEGKGPEDGAMIISSNLVDNEILGSAIDGKVANVNSFFILKKPVNGTYKFSWASIDTAVEREGDLVIHLNFVKYKEVKEGKIY